MDVALFICKGELSLLEMNWLYFVGFWMNSGNPNNEKKVHTILWYIIMLAYIHFFNLNVALHGHDEHCIDYVIHL